jgi:hypothetical protein
VPGSGTMVKSAQVLLGAVGEVVSCAPGNQPWEYSPETNVMLPSAWVSHPISKRSVPGPTVTTIHGSLLGDVVL